jgi:hypothetical protein
VGDFVGCDAADAAEQDTERDECAVWRSKPQRPHKLPGVDGPATDSFQKTLKTRLFGLVCCESAYPGQLACGRIYRKHGLAWGFALGWVAMNDSTPPAGVACWIDLGLL